MKKRQCFSRPGLEEESVISDLESDLYLKRVAVTLCDFREAGYQGAIFK